MKGTTTPSTKGHPSLRCFASLQHDNPCFPPVISAASVVVSSSIGEVKSSRPLCTLGEKDLEVGVAIQSDGRHSGAARFAGVYSMGSQHKSDCLPEIGPNKKPGLIIGPGFLSNLVF
jgi:hypothetical protein